MGRKSREKAQRRAARAERRRRIDRQRELGCLFCRGREGPFLSEEHIFPEALGNKDERFILPPGIVCDPCNSRLASVDVALVNFQPIALRVNMLHIPGKRGRVPEVRWGNAVVSSPKRGHLFITEKAAGAMTRTGPNSGRLSVKSAGPIRVPTYAKITRGLWKIAFELLWLDHGPDAMMESKYDELRAIIVGQQRAFSGWMIMPREGDPDHAQLTVSYQFMWLEDGREMLPVQAVLFGVHLYTELLVRKPAGLSEDEQKELEAVANVIVFDMPPARAADDASRGRRRGESPR